MSSDSEDSGIVTAHAIVIDDESASWSLRASRKPLAPATDATTEAIAGFHCTLTTVPMRDASAVGE